MGHNLSIKFLGLDLYEIQVVCIKNVKKTVL